MARKSFLATLLGVAAFAVPSALADQGGIPHDGSSGQGRPADQTQAQTTGKSKANGHAKVHAKAQALAKGHAKAHGKSQATTHGKALAKGQAKVQTTAPTNTHAKAGKTTICHATGSTKNPYVRITISNNALPAHRRHQDGRDIIPAPAGACPTTAQQQPAAQQAGGPTSASAPATPAAAQGQVLGESTGPQGKSPNKVSVLGASTGSAPSASSSPAATATRSSSGLPFTGTDAIIVALLGLAALLLGVAVRRATTNRA